ncbi:globin domain-containing protein [Roseobacter sp. A03A-229]
MTDDDRWRVQTSWACIAPIAPQAAEMFYDRLFALDPGLKLLFATLDMRAQKLALVQALSVAVAGLDDIDSLMPVLRDLGARHASYGVRDRHYAVMGQALIWTLERGLGPRAMGCATGTTQ